MLGGLGSKLGQRVAYSSYSIGDFEVQELEHKRNRTPFNVLVEFLLCFAHVKKLIVNMTDGKKLNFPSFHK
jgi:hypothetical protein